MSKIGRKSIFFDKTVQVTEKLSIINVIGPKGSLSMRVPVPIVCKISIGKIDIVSKDIIDKKKWGLVRSLLNNMIIGVTKAFTKKLKVVGIGYKFSIKGNMLVLSLGYCHDIGYVIPNDVELECDKDTILVIGIDKQRVGHVASEIRSLRKPEPYKGKGILYFNELIVRKEGKKK